MDDKADRRRVDGVGEPVLEQRPAMTVFDLLMAENKRLYREFQKAQDELNSLRDERASVWFKAKAEGTTAGNMALDRAIKKAVELNRSAGAALLNGFVACIREIEEAEAMARGGAPEVKP